MPEVQYSSQAETDLDDIATFTRQQWGQSQADSYFSSLVDTFETLARSPLIGRSYSDRYRNWRRFEHQSHVILYLPIPSGIRIQRLMHNRRKLQGADR